MNKLFGSVLGLFKREPVMVLGAVGGGLIVAGEAAQKSKSWQDFLLALIPIVVGWIQRSRVTPS